MLMYRFGNLGVTDSHSLLLRLRDDGVAGKGSLCNSVDVVL